MKRAAVRVAWLALVAAQIVAAQAIPAQIIAITGVTVINPGMRSVARNQVVLIDSGVIRSVTADSGNVPRGARKINGKGRYLIPGLWDSHVHLTKAGEFALPLFLANGVTSVRDLGSNLEDVLSWRAQIEAGSRIGPRIRTSGQILESKANFERQLREGGVEPYARIRIPVANPEEARAAVRRLAKAGADQIKMRTTPDFATFQAAVDEAHRLGLRFAAHPVAPPEQLLEARLDSVEHFLAVPPLTGKSAQEREALFKRAANGGLFMSTTISNLGGSLLISYEESKRHLNDTAGKIDSRRKYVCGYLLEDWKEQVEEKKEDSPAEFEKEIPGLYNDLKGLHAAGVPFLAGTDVAVAFMYPGFSLHDELAALVRDVGFSPMEALRAATYNPALFYRGEKTMGSIQAGMAADLVLLDADPLANIANTQRIRGVMARGRWFDRASLDQMLNGVERGAQGSCKADLPR